MAQRGPEDEPQVASLLATFSPHVAVLRRCRDDGAMISLTIVGEVRGDVVGSPREAERRKLLADESDAFKPFFDVDRVGVSLSAVAIRFLADIGASFHTHIDVEFEPDQ